ncbi:hypothetical protein ACFL2O_07695 [Thermodesulfobacteriota bacterium]
MRPYRFTEGCEWHWLEINAMDLLLFVFAWGCEGLFKDMLTHYFRKDILIYFKEKL